MDILEEFGVEVSDYKFLTASDNRKEKFSYRMYMKLAFQNLREYKHFITLLKEKVRPEVLAMIDPTSLMLRTPGSYKDQHQAKWMTPCSIEEAVLSYTDNCDMIDPQAPDDEHEPQFDELTTGLIKDAVALIATHPAVQGNYYYTGINKGFLCLKRIKPSHCGICDRVHDVSDAFATIYHGNVHLRCFRDDTKGSVFLGFIGEAEPIKFRWADAKALMNAQDRLKDNGMSSKEKSEMSNDNNKLFAEAKKAAYENEAVLKRDTYIFDDFVYIHGKTFPTNNEIMVYIKQTMNKILQGGNLYYITKSEWMDSKHFTELNGAPLRPRSPDEITYSTMNPKFKADEPISEKNEMIT
jgi:hypothetical protein